MRDMQNIINENFELDDYVMFMNLKNIILNLLEYY